MEPTPYPTIVGATPLTAPAGTPWKPAWIWLLVFVPLLPSPFPWAFSFISSIVYVIGRSVVVRRRTGKGISPLWVVIAVYLLVNIIVTFYLVGVAMNSLQQMTTYLS